MKEKLSAIWTAIKDRLFWLWSLLPGWPSMPTMPTPLRPAWLTDEALTLSALLVIVSLVFGGMGYKMHTLNAQVSLHQNAWAQQVEFNRNLLASLDNLQKAQARRK